MEEDDDFWKNVVSMGAHGRIQERERTYRVRCVQLQEYLASLEKRGEAVGLVAEELVTAKIAALRQLDGIKRISQNARLKDRLLEPDTVPQGTTLPDFDRIENLLREAKEHNILKAGSDGIAAGASTAAGVWALVGSLGVASTGTAIGGLSGAAATSATLAWFGGGALAAGGGGMALGTAVLGGLVTIPALLMYGLVNHAKASENIAKIAAEEAKLVAGIDEAKRTRQKMDNLERRFREAIEVLQKQGETFQEELDRVTASLNSPLARIGRFFRKLFTGSEYSNGEIEEVAYVFNLAGELATVIDQKFLDADGNLI